VTEPSPTNEQWLADLRSSGPRREAAVARLRDYLLRAILVYLIRHRSDLAHFHYDELEQLAEDWAQQSLIQILNNLDGFRGDSKFTTWSYRVAINLAAGELRRKRWENISLEGLTESESPDLRQREDASTIRPDQAYAQEQIWEVVMSIIENDLTERQRTALTRVVLEDVPVEVVAEELHTNRNNVYKIIHDARKKIKHELEQRDWSADDILSAFNGEGGD
jgi:RNA polymerase sigma-70 factor (ECF subfamily)